MTAFINNIIRPGLIVNPDLKAALQTQIAAYLSQIHAAAGPAQIHVPGLTFNRVPYTAIVQITGIAMGGTQYILDLHDLS
jgi:hypothetical protein